MGTLRVSYFTNVEKYILAKPIRTEKITTSASHAETGVFPQNAEVILVSTDANVVCCIGTAPVAADDSTQGQFYVPAGERPIHLGLRNVANSLKLSAITV